MVNGDIMLERTYFHCCLFKQIIKAFGGGNKSIMTKERNVPNTFWQHKKRRKVIQSFVKSFIGSPFEFWLRNNLELIWRPFLFWSPIVSQNLKWWWVWEWYDESDNDDHESIKSDLPAKIFFLYPSTVELFLRVSQQPAIEQKMTNGTLVMLWWCGCLGVVLVILLMTNGTLVMLWWWWCLGVLLVILVMTNVDDVGDEDVLVFLLVHCPVWAGRLQREINSRPL